MIHPFSSAINPDAHDMVWHYALGMMPCYIDESHGKVGWVRYSHRGIQFTDRIDFPRKEKRYIFSPKFQVRYNQKFEDVLRNCADLKREGHTWITRDVFDGYMNMHRLGFAHSYETWQDGQLVGGAIGVQIGGFITCETMYHHVSNASKAAWGQTLARLKERGFLWADTNCVATHHVNYGEEWVPQWRFEKMLEEAIHMNVSLADDIPCPTLPTVLKIGLPLARLLRKAARKARLISDPQPLREPAPTDQPAPPAEHAPTAPAPAPQPSVASSNA
jgi:leucyl/phenylalanyl-tRNA---protein transferase